MEHYSLDEWRLYVNDLMDEDKRAKMEEHLFGCDHCLEVYLDVVNEVDIDEKVLNEKFTEEVMEAVKDEKIPNKTKKRKKYPSNIFLYYTAAASITLLLMSHGFFTSMTRAIPRTAVQLMDTSKYVEKISQSSWTDAFIQRTMSMFEK